MPTVQVPADKHWFATGIQLTAECKYKITTSGDWFDDKIKCGPDGYTLQGTVPEWQWPLFRMVEPLRPIDTGDTWFQLVGKVGNSVFVIGSQQTYIPHADGELLCTANDCPFMYWNNSGMLLLSIEQV